MSADEWVPLFDGVKVKRSEFPTVDPDEVLRRVMTAALRGPIDRFNPLQFRPSCTVGEVVALALMAGAMNGERQ